MPPAAAAPHASCQAEPDPSGDVSSLPNLQAVECHEVQELLGQLRDWVEWPRLQPQVSPPQHVTRPLGVLGGFRRIGLELIALSERDSLLVHLTTVVAGDVCGTPHVVASASIVVVRALSVSVADKVYGLGQRLVYLYESALLLGGAAPVERINRALRRKLLRLAGPALIPSVHNRLAVDLADALYFASHRFSVSWSRTISSSRASLSMRIAWTRCSIVPSVMTSMISAPCRSFMRP